MARGYPDYASSSDKQEVVIRPTLVSTTGKVLLYDNFDAVYNAWYSNGSAGSTVNIVVDNYFNTGSCVKLTPPAGANKFAGMNRLIPVPESKSIGLECVFGMEYEFVGKVHWRMAANYGSVSHKAEVKYDQTTKKWSIYTSAGFVEIPNSTMTIGVYTNTFTRIKLIVDFNTDKYVKLFVNHHLYDLSAYDCSGSMGAAGEQLVLNIYGINDAVGNAYSVWIDNYIISEEE